VSCNEFSSANEEYMAFQSGVLDKLQAGEEPVTRYFKNGEAWQLAYAHVNFGTVSYILLAVVPVRDIRAVTIAVEKQVQQAVTTQVIIFAVLVAVSVFLLTKTVQFIIKSVVQPLIELRQICDHILEDDLASDVPKDPSSQDMQVKACLKHPT
jgi:hypothetical protein